VQNSGEEDVEDAENVLDVGEAEEQIVLEGGARVFLRADVAVAERRAAERLVGEEAAVERHLPAALAALEDQAGAVEELAAAEAGAQLGADVALADEREARARSSVPPASTTDRRAGSRSPGRRARCARRPPRCADEPGEELAARKRLAWTTARKSFVHASALLEREVRDVAAVGLGSATRLVGETLRTASTARVPRPTCSAARYGISGTGAHAEGLAEQVDESLLRDAQLAGQIDRPVSRFHATSNRRGTGRARARRRDSTSALICCRAAFPERGAGRARCAGRLRTLPLQVEQLGGHGAAIEAEADGQVLLEQDVGRIELGDERVVDGAPAARLLPLAAVRIQVTEGAAGDGTSQRFASMRAGGIATKRRMVLLRERMPTGAP
jgi:hypothetical protein